MATASTIKSSTHTESAKGNGLLLYHHPYSFYSQKVLLALHEKKLPFKSHIVNLIKGEQYHPWFLQINPRGEVPVLNDGVKIIPDSGRIIDYLEDNFSNGDTPRLLFSDQGSEIRSKIQIFRVMIDELPAGAITMGSFFHSEFCRNQKPPFIRPVRKTLLAAERNSSSNLRINAEKNPESREVLLQKATSQDIRHQKLTDKKEFMNLLHQVDLVLKEVEEELRSHTEDKIGWWLCSDRFTVADISLTILLDRLNRLGLEDYFWSSGKKPFLTNYYNRVQERESYKKTVPSSLVHLKILLQMEAPLAIGISIVAFAVIIGGILYIRRNKYC